ncbi:hypothetical protein AALP_AAs39041U000100 [Arabis alpina]|uniref:Protein kinase domain-containing protein n=1 Tax=Arabis alpina TaxID=50452 RepID=A0A087G0E2_ARAAL|nr:hypothetical protein AALP_AAs39041U000100 [Arabis alpina]
MKKQSITNTCCSSMSSSWVRGTCIGRGSFGTVNTAINKTNGEVFAVKSVDLATCLPAQTESLENEISVLKSLKPHSYIVTFLGDSFSKEETTTFRNLHLEYLQEGDVANHHVIADETLLRRYTACLVSAPSHVHSQADFGSAIRIGKSPATGLTPRGNPLWMAPEVIRREYQGPESDVWSIGCTVIEIVTRKPAWEDKGIGFSDELPVFPFTLSENGCDFLDKCLKRDRSQRWSCDQLLQHPFLSQCHDLSHTESSPRCVLDWVNSGFEICNLVTIGGVNWEFDGWVEVRNHTSEEERARVEYSESANIALYRTPENRRSAMMMSYELVIVVFLLMRIMVYSTCVYSIISFMMYGCYQYHCDHNKELEMLSFNLRSRSCRFVLDLMDRGGSWRFFARSSRTILGIKVGFELSPVLVYGSQIFVCLFAHVIRICLRGERRLSVLIRNG